MEFLRLRWCAPIMALGGASIDGYAQALPIPSDTMIAGMLGAALGIRRGSPRLADLADALTYGVVVHRTGSSIVDYQTADLEAIGTKAVAVDQTGAIRTVEREGSAIRETAISHRPLLCDADMTVVAAVAGEDAWTLLDSLNAPVFSLYLGRASCPPGRRVGEGVLDASSLDDALTMVSAEIPGIVYRPARRMTDGLVVQVSGRDRAPRLFELVAA